jgi:hypothetical protein
MPTRTISASTTTSRRTHHREGLANSSRNLRQRTERYGLKRQQEDHDGKAEP